MKKILAVDDHFLSQRLWAKQLKKHRMEIISAYTLQEANAVLDRGVQFDLVVMDGCLDGGNYDTSDLIKRIRSSFQGHIIAVSSLFDIRKSMIEDGCNLEAEKEDVVEMIIDLLK